ncbi:hypothetical protein CDAR_48561 [Caerostris darwini]|uniref:Uncharacterized protein n=1 Tax=Caerostris darwini TaxID=1538125 RepID=A0AAV4NHJ6_9ARAC|nr:hypothetical protein CDAR_48561 [Caerostris darwini]
MQMFLNEQKRRNASMFPVCQATKGCEWLETRPQLKKPDRSIYSQPRTPPYPVSPRSCKMGNAYKSFSSQRISGFQENSRFPGGEWLLWHRHWKGFVFGKEPCLWCGSGGMLG